MEQLPGQMNIFDFAKDTGIEVKDLSMKEAEQKTVETAICTKRFECDSYPTGCGGTIEPCRFGGPFKWGLSQHKCNEAEQCIDNVPHKELRTPCNRMCEVEWCSKVCYEKRGYMWDKYSRGWIRDKQDKCLIRDKKDCDWEPKKEQPKTDLLTLDNLRPCDCGYTGRKAVAVTGCGIPTNGYLDGPRIYEKYLFAVFCPVCYRTATSGPPSEWASNKTDKQQAMQDWQKYPLKESYTWRHEYLKKHADKMNETVKLFEGFIDEVEE